MRLGCVYRRHGNVYFSRDFHRYVFAGYNWCVVGCIKYGVSIDDNYCRVHLLLSYLPGMEVIARHVKRAAQTPHEYPGSNEYRRYQIHFVNK